MIIYDLLIYDLRFNAAKVRISEQTTKGFFLFFIPSFLRPVLALASEQGGDSDRKGRADGAAIP